jgi:oligopeptide/dipeptide ABC transporter ATP-binding protein
MIGHPKLLIADEPTSLLDLQIQLQILHLLLSPQKIISAFQSRRLQEKMRSYDTKKNSEHKDDIGIILITHDFPLLAKNTDKMGVIYSGQLIEHTATENLLIHPHHPYSKSLLKSIKKKEAYFNELKVLKGKIPRLNNLPVGCRFGPRCQYAIKECVEQPELKSIPNHGKVRCHIPLLTVKH